jgi:hypothetical protein
LDITTQLILGEEVFFQMTGFPFSIHFSGTVFHFSTEKYTLVFDGDDVIGVYDINDYWLNKNLNE